MRKSGVFQSNMLAEIQSNFEKLIALYEAAVQRSKDLEAELARERAVSDDLRKQTDDLRERISNLELRGAFTAPGEGSSSAARAKIDSLIKEIDKCITLLEKD